MTVFSILSVLDQERRSVDGWFNRSAIILRGMAIKNLKAWRQDRPGARFRGEDVLAVLRSCWNFCSVIQCSGINPYPVRPTLKCQSELGSTRGTEMDVYVLSTAF